MFEDSMMESGGKIKTKTNRWMMLTFLINGSIASQDGIRAASAGRLALVRLCRRGRGLSLFRRRGARRWRSRPVINADRAAESGADLPAKAFPSLRGALLEFRDGPQA